MATQILIAHTGQRHEIDTSQFASLDDIKTWIGRNSSIPPQHIIALTPQGRSVKSASVHTEREIYIYDIRTTQAPPPAGAASLISEVPLPERYTVPNAPNSIADVQSISSWQELYKERRTWALRLHEDCEAMSAAARARYDEIDVMSRCLDAAVANLEISVKQIEPKYTELKKWVEPALAEHARLVSSWQQYLTLARNTPVAAPLVKFMTRGEVRKDNPTLEDLIEPETAKKAGKLAPTAHRRFSEKAAELGKAANDMYQGLEKLIAEFDKLMGRSVFGHSEDSVELLQDIEAVVKQIDSDYRTALSYSATQRDIAQASKTASNHTERLVPTLKKRVTDMDEIIRYATQARNTIASESVGFMRAITEITSLRSSVKDQINILNQSEDDMTTFDYLRLIHQLPYMYASFVVEAVRRREWVDKVKTDSSTLANEMALFQDEESKRRRKWQKMVGSTYGPGLDTNVMGLEVSLLGEDNAWPPMTKDQLESFLETLRAQGTDDSILDDVSQLIQELNSPTKQQSRRVKAFKNGSIHEAALGRSGLMIRGDDDLLRSLQDDKTKLESKVKTAESRVRRLEDLLHRQSQATRPGSLFQPPSNSTRERNDSGSSIKSYIADDRRRSSDGGDPLLRKITQLENELREEKQRSAHIQKELADRTTQHDDIKDQMQDANSTKRDLMENMEALKKEFVDERKSFEDEIKLLRARLEDTEEEIESFGESRENEKAHYDQRVQLLEAELENHSKERQDEMLKAQGQVDFLRNETRIQREQNEELDRHLQIAREEARSASKRLQEIEPAADSYLDALRELHSQLASDEPVPDDPVDLADSVQTFVADLIAKVKNVETDVSLLRTNVDQASRSAEELRAELTTAQEKLAEEEVASLHLREHVAKETAKVKALEKELAQSRDELSQLRSQLSDGETGSETLQKKLADEETKLADLMEQLAARQSQVGGLEEELHMYKERQEFAQTKLNSIMKHYESRDERSRDLTERLYSQNDRMRHLLERIGYSMTREEGQMTINKIPRPEKSTHNPNDSSDPGTSLRKSITLGSRTLQDSADLDLLKWTNPSDAAAEAEKYQAFLDKLGDFDIDLFSDTVYHRIREMEYKARKWQREARNYRDRAHALQKESHDKIAYRHFKDGDLALFLPTRNQQAGAWAAFNVGFPHYFLREQDAHRLRHREWLVARINRIQERVVDLSKSLQPSNEADSINDEENDNPFQLSDGLRWYLIDALEDKPGAPATPGMGKSTVAANNVEATASIHAHAIMSKGKGKKRESVNSIEGINKSLSKSLESRRSSSTSKKALPFAGSGGAALLKSSAIASETNSLRAAAPETPAGTSPTQGGGMATIGASGQGETADNEDAGKAPESRARLERQESVESPTKRSVVLDVMWSVEG